MSKGSSGDGHGQSTTAGDVRARNTNPDILQNIRGTVVYFRNALYDLLAMFRCLGPPTLFMTLSADDLHWPELGMLLVAKLQTHSHSNYCMKSSKPPCRFGFPKRLCQHTVLLSHIVAVKNKGKFYDTYRPSDSLLINAYNPEILRHWRANMDIQLINDANGAAYYVCHYLCKSEPEELKCALANLINTVFKQNPDMTAFQYLWNVSLCVLKNRRV
ncbi:hypothetical protein MAR_026981 [Mya arenaria]|uniref:Helitron helicase-like domain-containing protein n=1 Tax=Mya arenaria TaxID=6604 RepID=A0ABY7EVR0_MYAAR|nr:hypothetical protein MAR_026981 [Mya arenaria]